MGKEWGAEGGRGRVEDVGRDTSSGSAEEEGGTETARRPLVLSKGGRVDDRWRLT